MWHRVFGTANGCVLARRGHAARHSARYARHALSLALACAAWLAWTDAQAQARAEGRYYLELGYASGLLQPDTDDSHFSVAEERPAGFKIAAGHVINRQWGLEAFWTDLGETVMAPDDSVLKFTQYGLFGVYNTPLAGRWDLSLKFGAAVLDAKWRHDFSDEGRINPAGGITLRLPFQRYWWLALSYDAYTRDAAAVAFTIGRYFGIAPDWGQAWLASQDTGAEGNLRTTAIAAVDHAATEQHAGARQLAVLPDRAAARDNLISSSGEKIRTISVADVPEPVTFAGSPSARAAPLREGRDDVGGFGPPPAGGGALQLDRLEWGPYSNLERAQRAAKLARRSTGDKPTLTRRQGRYWLRLNVPDARVPLVRERIDAALRAASLRPDATAAPPAIPARPASASPASPAGAGGKWRVQLASFADVQRAEQMRSALAARGYAAALVQRRSKGRLLQSVQVSLPSRQAAQRFRRWADREYRVRSVLLRP